MIRRLAVLAVVCAAIPALYAAPDRPPDVWIAPYMGWLHQGDQVTIVGTAEDRNSEDTLTPSWSQTYGPAVPWTNNGWSITVTVPRNAPTGTSYGFTLTVSDGDDEDSAGAGIYVMNGAPQVFIIPPATSIPSFNTASVSATATDPEGDAMTYQWTQISGPSVSLSGANSLSVSFVAPYVPSTSFVTLEVKVRDEHDAETTAQVSFMITPPPLLPPQDTIAVTVDSENAPVPDSLVTGTISIGTIFDRRPLNGMITGLSATPLAMPPDAEAMTMLSTPVDTPLDIVLAATDPDGDSISYAIHSFPGVGTAAMVNADTVRFTPGAGFTGMDGLIVRASDGKGGDMLASINIAVGPGIGNAPTVLEQIISVAHGTPKVYALSADDLDGDVLTFTTLGSMRGTVGISGVNATYSPFISASGTDYHPWRVTDGHSYVYAVDEMTISAPTVEDASAYDGDPDMGGRWLADATGTYGDVVFDLDTAAMADGVHNVWFLGVDAAGARAKASLRLKVDNTRPVLEWLSYPGKPRFDKPVRSKISATVRATDPGAVLPDDNIQFVKLMEMNPGDATVNLLRTDTFGTYALLDYDTAVLPDGLATFRVNATDRANNVSNPIQIRLLIDNTNPTGTITLTPAPVAIDSKQVVRGSLTIQANTQDPTAGLYETAVSLVNGTVVNELNKYTAGTWWYEIENSMSVSHALDSAAYSDGAWDVRAVAQDHAGNIRELRSAIVIDNTAPTVTVSAPAAGAVLSSLSEIRVSASDLHGASIQSIKIGAVTQSVTFIAPDRYVLATPVTAVGAKTLTVRATDGVGNIADKVVAFRIAAGNTAPTASAQSISLNEDTPKPIVLSGTDPESSPLTYALVTSPTKGALTGIAPNLTYTPQENSNGTDSFTFKVNDGVLDSEVAAVSLTIHAINDKPVANAQFLTVDEDDSSVLQLSGSDVDSDALTFRISDFPDHGAISGTLPNLVYTPAADYYGADSFQFIVNDGTLDSDSATVSITVAPINDVPVAISATVSTGRNTDKTISLNAFDPEAQPLTYSIVTPPVSGSLIGTASDVLYRPERDYVGSDSFQFRVNDGSDDSNVATISIRVLGDGDANHAPTADDKSVSVQEDGSVSIALSGADLDLDPLTYEIVEGPTHGVMSDLSLPDLTYTPDADYFGSDTIRYRVNDGKDDSALATVAISVTAVNDAPSAEAISASTIRNQSKVVTLSGTDKEGASLIYQVISGPSHGTLDSTTSQTPRYTPTANYIGADSFQYRVSDGDLQSAGATVSLTITAGNNPPTGADQDVDGQEDGTISLNLEGADVDGDTLTYILVDGPVHGTIEGTLPYVTYRPTLNFHGADSLTYRISDGIAQSRLITVTIDIASVNDAPVIDMGTISVPNGDFVRGTVPIRVEVDDADGTTPTVVIRIDGGAEILVPRIGSDIYELPWDTDPLPEGTHTIEIIARDGSGGETRETVTVTVDRTAPFVNTINITEGQTVSGVQSIQATVGDSAALDKVEILVDGTVVSSRDLSGTSGVATYSMDTTALPDGTHQIQIRTTDEAGNVNILARTIIVSNGTVELLPDFEILNPGANAVVSGAVTLRIRLTQGTALSTGYTLDGGALIAMSNVGDGQFEKLANFGPVVVDGFHTLEFSVTGAAGTRKRSVTIRVDNTAPVVSIAAPTAGRKLYFVQQLIADASDGGHPLDTVTFRLNSEDVALFSGHTNTAERLYTYLLDTEATNDEGLRLFPDGSYTLTVIAKDKAGNATQATVGFLIDNINIPLSGAEVEVFPAPGAFTVTDEQSAISARVRGVAVAAASVSGESLRVFIDKDGFREPGNKLPRFMGTVRLSGDTISFSGHVPANSIVTCQLMVPDINGDLIRVTWSFKRAMARVQGGSAANGEFSIFIPPMALKADSFVNLQTSAPTDQLDEANRAFDSIFDGYKELAGPYSASAERSDGTFEPVLDQDAFLTFSRPLGNIPPQDRSFLPQLQQLVAGNDGRSSWRPLGTSGLSSNSARSKEDVSGARTVSVRVRQLGVFRVTGFAAPAPGVSEVFNFPNPFSPGEENTSFHYMLGSDSDVTILIYDLLGNLVRKMEIASGANGGRASQNIVPWDGRNGAGDVVANGGYIIQIIAKDSNGGTSRIRHKVGVVK